MIITDEVGSRPYKVLSGKEGARWIRHLPKMAIGHIYTVRGCKIIDTFPNRAIIVVAAKMDDMTCISDLHCGGSEESTSKSPFMPWTVLG